MSPYARSKTALTRKRLLFGAIIGIALCVRIPAINAFSAKAVACSMAILRADASDPQSEPEISGDLKVLRRVIPAYPDELRRKGIAGRVELQVGIDEKGTVGGVRIVKPLHPYLDNAAVQALKQWRFEPVRRNGVPVPAVITLTVNFTREAYRTRPASAEGQKEILAGETDSSQVELPRILAKSAEYCERLESAALDYICEETTRDVFHNLFTKEEMEKSPVVLSMVTGPGSISQLGIPPLPMPNPKRTEKNDYVCDYLLVKKGDTIEGRRIVLKENGRRLPDRKRVLEERRLSTLLPFFAPVRLLGRQRQPLLDYRLLGAKTISGKKAYIIGATSKTGGAAGIEQAQIWLEEKNGRVLKVEITGVPVEGYESVLRELIQYNVTARCITTYEYEIEKKGMAFPSSVRVRVYYPMPGLEVETFIVGKISTDIKYDKYKFFTVETESGIRK